MIYYNKMNINNKIIKTNKINFKIIFNKIKKIQKIINKNKFKIIKFKYKTIM